MLFYQDTTKDWKGITVTLFWLCMNDNINPICLGGFCEQWGNKQFHQGNRVYSSNSIAMAIGSQPQGHLGGYSYLYLIKKKDKKND